MAKKDDDIKEAIDNEMNRRLIKLIRTVCVTATAGFITALYNIGKYLFDRWDALKAAILLFIEITKRGGQ